MPEQQSQVDSHSSLTKTKKLWGTDSKKEKLKVTLDIDGNGHSSPYPSCSKGLKNLPSKGGFEKEQTRRSSENEIGRKHSDKNRPGLQVHSRAAREIWSNLVPLLRSLRNPFKYLAEVRYTEILSPNLSQPSFLHSLSF